MSSQERTIAGRYRVVEEAGRGGMGAVWRCIDERLGREVAVKQVGRPPGESVTDQARALREARSSAALNHPNVVSVYDAIAEDDHLWLVMEYVPGRTLSQIVRDDGPLPPARAAAILAQVADGLAAAHERGTVHRDVKPGNVLVKDDDSAKISDFGIARTVGDETLTQTGMVSGTPAYFAPEIARGGDPTPASDVWALGATLFAAVEGRPPYGTSSNALALLSTIAAEEPAAPVRAGPLTEPLRRMLDRDPAARMSMAEVARVLHDVQGPSSPPVETREDAPALVATAPIEAGTGPPVAAEPVPATTPTPVEPTPAAATSEPRRSRRGLALLLAGLLALLVVVIGAVALLGDDPAETPTADDETTDTSPSPEESPSDTASESPEDEPTASASESSSEPAGSEPVASGGGSRTAFVEDYYAVLPEDTETGWSLLSPDYQSRTSYGDYDGFWSTIEDVTVQDTVPAGGDAVDVTLLYNGEEQEVRRIYLERGEDGWLIADDEVVG